MNRSPVYFVDWRAHPGHPWTVLSSKCRVCWPSLLRIVWGGR
jgi:hypothetical protein